MLRFIWSPGGAHFPCVEVCADTGMGLIRVQKVQWAEAATTMAGKVLRPLDWLSVTVIANINPSHWGAAGQWGPHPVSTIEEQVRHDH